MAAAITIMFLIMCILSCCRSEPHRVDEDIDMIRHFSEALNIPLVEAERMLQEVKTSEPSVIERRLLLGNALGAADRDVLRQHNVTHVVNATHNLPNHFEGDLSYLRVPVDDSLTSDLHSHLNDVIDWIAAALSDPYASGAVFIHCQQGVSRSATITLAFLMRERGHSLASARDYVHQRRFIRPNDAFVEQLRRYEGSMLARGSRKRGR